MSSAKTLFNGVIGVVFILLLLAVSCPDEDSFDRWAKRTLAGNTESGLENAKGKVLATQANWTADYKDRVLWATVDAYQGGTSHRYVGLLWMWFNLGKN